MISNFEGKTIGTEQEILDLRWANASEGEVIADLFSSTDTDRDFPLNTLHLKLRCSADGI